MEYGISEAQNKVLAWPIFDLLRGSRDSRSQMRFLYSGSHAGSPVSRQCHVKWAGRKGYPHNPQSSHPNMGEPLGPSCLQTERARSLRGRLFTGVGPPSHCATKVSRSRIGVSLGLVHYGCSLLRAPMIRDSCWLAKPGYHLKFGQSFC